MLYSQMFCGFCTQTGVRAREIIKTDKDFVEKWKNPDLVDQTKSGFFQRKREVRKWKRMKSLICLYYTPGVLKNKGENIKEVLSR